MKQVSLHKHYVGAAHSFEIVKNTDATAGQYVRPDVTILKTFFINDKVNVNDWQATWEGLKEDAKELPGVPLVLKEDLQHPKFSVQEMFDRGTIFDYDIDEENHQTPLLFSPSVVRAKQNLQTLASICVTHFCAAISLSMSIGILTVSSKSSSCSMR